MRKPDQSEPDKYLHAFQDRLKHLFKVWKARPFTSSEKHFPAELLNALREMGALDFLFPVGQGGCGLSCSAEGCKTLLMLLRRTGYLNLSLGRCLEGHVNVLRLVELYGTASQHQALARALQHGVLAGIWVTDGTPPVTMRRHGEGYVLSGIKGFASGVSEVGLALITATNEEGVSVMVLAPTKDADRRRPGPGTLTGMQASGTGAYDFTDVFVTDGDLVGEGGDYLRQPEFSAGAWRGSAVALGGMDRLVDLLREELLGRGRAENPHQLHRIGKAVILQKTAAMWVEQAASAVCHSSDMSPEDVTATVNLARIAVEEAALELIVLVQRGLGLSAFVQGRAVEQVMRDLATYLRQPAPDEVLTEAAAWFIRHDRPEDRI
ncbi:acyl-CoA/acyl-ACP dehydrogenase [Gluconobacter sp. Dm-62]|uniref:acyl-CoA dehydrogenase family protein n=1 Tax=Gluconobacter sp. Dm-62 TaxID=2799804 RepID=UPI001B8D1A77|nr:acyl-CoA dehydrogenase family protein [Gluconobacter sp. Dm-62]MBS1103489.1 acyl-CoA/acyl-ACP dehydrogenase [Gluconobacter sp. Dm-62]